MEQGVFATMTDAAYPHAVWIRVPLLGLTERQELEDAAAAIGDHEILDELDGADEWVRFGFIDGEDAVSFRSAAASIVEQLVTTDPLSDNDATR
jgi:hypothetical protein